MTSRQTAFYLATGLICTFSLVVLLSRPLGASDEVSKGDPPVGQPPPATEAIHPATEALLDERKKLRDEINSAKNKGIGVSPYEAEFARIEELLKSGGTEAEARQRIDSLLETIKGQVAQQEILKNGNSTSAGSGGDPFLQRGTAPWEMVHNPRGNAQACKSAEAAGTIHVLAYDVLLFQDKKPFAFKTGQILGDPRYDAYNLSVKKLAAIRMCEINKVVKKTPGVLAAGFYYAPFVLARQPYTFDMQLIYDARSKNIRPMVEKIQKDYHVACLRGSDRPIRYMPEEPGRRDHDSALGMSPPPGLRRIDHFPFNLDFEKSDGIVPWSYNDR